MFSQLGPLFRTTLRQAESTGARLEIRRDEKQEDKKHHDDTGEENEPSALWEDTTTVSVEALQTFLLEFLKSKGDYDPSIGNTVFVEQIYQPKPLVPSNEKTARAIRAYASHTVSDQSYSPPLDIHETSKTSLHDLLRSDELRTIHRLIEELNGFSRTNVQILTIEKADSFLLALVNAVELQKAKF